MRRAIEIIILLGMGLMLMSICISHMGDGITQGPGTEAMNDVTQLVTAAKSYQAEYGKMPEGGAASILRALQGENLKKIIFLEINPKKISKEGLFLDPWGAPYLFDFSTSHAPWAYSSGNKRRDFKTWE